MSCKKLNKPAGDRRRFFRARAMRGLRPHLLTILGLVCNTLFTCRKALCDVSRSKRNPEKAEERFRRRRLFEDGEKTSKNRQNTAKRRKKSIVRLLFISESGIICNGARATCGGRHAWIFTPFLLKNY